MPLRFLHILFLLIPILAFSQDFNYVHYSTKDGLAGSTVYDVCQDKSGFIFFATENGLSRYDGTDIKNYTVKDGLPDNEVLKVFSDSRGRTWIGTFNKEICYYFNGKIYNKHNDSLVRKIKLTGIFASAAEDDEGTIALCDTWKIVLIHRMKNNQESLKVITIPGKSTVLPFWSCNGKKIMAGNDQFKRYLYENGNMRFSHKTHRIYNENENFHAQIALHTTCTDSVDKTVPFIPGSISASVFNNYMIYYNSTDGVWQTDTILNKWGNHFLPGLKVSRTISDTEKNTWFATLGDGVYKLPSAETRTIRLPEQPGIRNEIFSLGKYGNQLLGGLDQSGVLFVDPDKKSRETKFKGNPSSIFRPQGNRLFTIEQVSPDITLLGFDFHLVKLEKGITSFCYISPIKSIARIDDKQILLGTSGHVFKIRVHDLKITDTIWHERSTKVFYHNGHYFIGTTNGLYAVQDGKAPVNLGLLHPALTRRITDIKRAGDSTLWISTSDQGIVALQNNRVVATITDSVGLSSNICKTLFIHRQFLWAGTNKGLNKIDISRKDFPILKYSISDGLPSDNINAVYVEDSMVYIGSPAGLTYFNEKNISTRSVCLLRLQRMEVSGQEKDTAGFYQLPYRENSIRFTYVGISFKSGGDITYYYKLNGLDQNWNQTRQTTLEYPALPPGKYELQLYAVNKFGVRSETLKIKFFIATPFWKSLWFYLMLLLSAVLLTGWLVQRSNKKYQKKLEETNRYQKQFAALEQQALQSQMNPHFIFNCLNSIQQYILTNEREKANEYLTGFASLIRQTLDISAQKMITVADEASYLEKYLQMERMRFGDSFTYSVIIDPEVKADEEQLPALLLQPYVENSIRHGLRYKTEGIGKVDIRFSFVNGNLCCRIQDNGIGRAKAAEFKSRQHIEYQSKGMNLTSKRISLLNTIAENKITVTITDLRQPDGQAAGTLVEIKLARI